MKKANRSSKIINFKDFNTGYNAVSEREDNIIGKKIADFRAANKMSLTDLRILLEIYGTKAGVKMAELFMEMIKNL